MIRGATTVPKKMARMRYTSPSATPIERVRFLRLSSMSSGSPRPGPWRRPPDLDHVRDGGTGPDRAIPDLLQGVHRPRGESRGSRRRSHRGVPGAWRQNARLYGNLPRR